MNLEKNSVLDINEEFWDLADEKVIWDGVPNVNHNLYIALVAIPVFMGLIAGYICYIYEIGIELIIFSFAASISYFFIIIFAIYDNYKKKKRNKYCLLSRYLVIRAGDKLTTKGFEFTSIKDVENKDGSKYVDIFLHNKILHPFTFISYRTDKITIGPLDNAEGVAYILKDYILNTEVDYVAIPKKKKIPSELWNDDEESTLWEGQPIVEDRLYNNLKIGIGVLVLVMLVTFFLIIYLGVLISWILVLMVYLFIFLIIVLYQLRRVRMKSFYRLQSKYLIAKAGYRLIDIRFDLSAIKDVYAIKGTHKLRIILNRKINHPFKFVRELTSDVKIGPFENPEEVAGIIKKQVEEVNRSEGGNA